VLYFSVLAHLVEQMGSVQLAIGGLSFNLQQQQTSQVAMDVEQDKDIFELPLRTLSELDRLEASVDLHPSKARKLVRMMLLRALSSLS